MLYKHFLMYKCMCELPVYIVGFQKKIVTAGRVWHSKNHNPFYNLCLFRAGKFCALLKHYETYIAQLYRFNS